MGDNARVYSTGQLLSESDTGVDYLGESVYAEAIARSIHLAKTSITIGIYGKWGSGKSFLLRHIEGILRRYQNQYVADEGAAEGPTTINSCSKARTLCLWLLFLAAIFSLITVSLILAVEPSLLVPFSAEVQPLDELTEAPDLDISSTAGSVEITTAASPFEEYQRQLEKLRIVGLILIPLELLILFAMGCFGRNWTSRRKYRGFTLLAYGAFTRLPLQSQEKEIVQDPGQAPANVLRYATQGNERLAMAASEQAQFPRKYIFVDFKAWQYAGSDSLWAAIVTQISDAIEDEFGAISTRLFRMLTIKEVEKKKLGEAKKTLYLQFASDATRESIRNMMDRYGVIRSMRPCSNIVLEEGFQWWAVTYATDGEYRYAKDCLKIEGVRFRTCNPVGKRVDDMPIKRGSKGRQSKFPLVAEEIPLKNVGKDDENDKDDESDEDDNAEVPAAKVDLLSKICCCCDRFCFHFVRHPVMQWKIPRLLWWIILPVCCILIPVTAYITASALNLDVEQTYRNVPMFGQVLLWLPASAAVTLAVSKFVWGMCHSQRQRINRALDGTKGRMASQLGFMSKVKSEIQVMTNLIRCARFIQQRDYRVIIAIDDLDRLDVNKVHSVLESISILLSDKTSPFICLIAADPRIVVKCIEESIGAPMREAKMSGREYLKKIINLPVCLPEIKDSDKRRYVAGLIDQSDRTATCRIEEHKMKITSGSGDVPDSGSQELSHPEFLYECRRFLYDNIKLHRHLRGNPRNMKRIFNVVSMTSFVIDCIVKKQERREFIQLKAKAKDHDNQTAVSQVQDRIVRSKELAENLVLWITLVDQWPYRTSFIIQRIEDADQRVAAGSTDEEIPNNHSIVDIYTEKVVGNLGEPGNYLMTLDDDPELFQTYLQLLGERGFTKRDVLSLLKITINLDYSIRRTIAFSLDPPPFNKRPPTRVIRDAGDVLTDTESENSAPNEHSLRMDDVADEIPETVC